ncbi:aspartate aminotransferase family protein [Alkalihalobacillus macyae]|uniref:pyridoxal phosphate-dependent decarboxylase family protein n=1 Tax=Guptibacillus hwajinpoensis TaxID=208199 RepID=UPI00273CB5B4|nr:aspartate aminotransferase family protein [Alkalihalobacillus macyae]MDP4549932.1 aspartate aminotransferase family protein [Alkalihalobacillus macyae]
MNTTVKVNPFDTTILNNDVGSRELRDQLLKATEALISSLQSAEHPYSGKAPEEIESEIRQLVSFGEDQQSFSDVVDDLSKTVIDNSLFISNEKSIAHLHCPPLIPAVVGELLIGAMNQSLDSWDQSPSATFMDQEMIQWLTNQFGYSEASDGVFTSGGTQSNYMSVLLARDAYCRNQWNHDVKQRGLPKQFNRMRILCSESAHFTVKKSAAQLGLGENAVITVQTDENHRMSLSHLRSEIAEMKSEGLVPFLIVGTCGTTDFGSIDPIQELAIIAKEEKLWLHIDAAFGGALILSHSHREKLNGIHQANSITVDFHKLFYQPISCGAFLLKNGEHFSLMNHVADYLNPEEDRDEGILNLVSKSTQTTRRFDSLKLYLSLKTIGTDLFARLIDSTFELATDVADYLSNQDDFEVLTKEPELNTVVFRYVSDQEINQVNRNIQQELYHSYAAIAKTTIDGKNYLKFTMLNPRTTLKDVIDIIDHIRVLGEKWRKHV